MLMVSKEQEEEKEVGGWWIKEKEIVQKTEMKAS